MTIAEFQSEVDQFCREADDFLFDFPGDPSAEVDPRRVEACYRIKRLLLAIGREAKELDFFLPRPNWVA